MNVGGAVIELAPPQAAVPSWRNSRKSSSGSNRATRVRVLLRVHAHPHADTDTILGVVRTGPALTSARLLRRIQPSGLVARYEARVGDNHHHMVCRLCGTITDVDCAVGEAPCLTPSEHNGFQLDEAEVIYWGVCPNCPTREVLRHARDRGPIYPPRKELL
jgi:Fur family ferric uptake transcriptional regulator